MRMFLAAGLALAAAAPAPAHADEFLRRYQETRGFSLGRPRAPFPTRDGKVLFLRSAPRSTELALYEYDTATKTAREWLTAAKLLGGAAETLTAEERARRERMRVTLRGLTSFEVSEDETLVLAPLAGKLYVARRGGDGAVTELKTGPGAIDAHFSPDGAHVAYVRDDDLYVVDLAAGHERRLTTKPPGRVTNGVAEFAAQEELGRHRGNWWSPDGKHLLFEQADSSDLPIFYIPDPAHPEKAPEATPYPRAGGPNAKLKLGIVPVAGGKPTWVEWDAAKLPYVGTVDWRDSAPLTITVLSRDQKELEVLAVDERGHTRRLVADHDDAWLDTDPALPRWLSDGSGFVWWTRGQLELRGKDGAKLRALSTPATGYRKLVDVDERARTVTWEGGGEQSENHVYQTSLDGGEPKQLDRDPGEHAAVFARDHRLWVETASSLAASERLLVHTENGADPLPSVAEAAGFTPRAEIFRDVGPLGFRAVVVRPQKPERGKKLPVLLEVYGGPHVRMVRASADANVMRQWYADQGFIVVALDGRGSAGRDHDWARVISGSFARTILDDQVAGLQALGARVPEMDLGRVGVFGWSFGGWLSAFAVLRRPDVFKVGVAGAPVVDWRDYDTCYTERYLGMPDARKAAYDESSLLTYAKDLSRPLLVVHGTADDNVYFFHSLRLADAFLRAGKTFSFLPLPGLTHQASADTDIKIEEERRVYEFLSSALR